MAKMAGRVAVVVVVLLTAIAIWQTRGTGPDLSRVAVVRSPEGIMGTTCTLVAVVPRGREAHAQRGLDAAEQALREVDALMSTYLESSEISAVNRAAADELVSVSEELASVLVYSRDVWRASDGAFDATCRPMIELWRRAGREGSLPADAEMDAARESSSWKDFELLDNGVRKAKDTARLDLGGVAKGFGIDRAFEAIRAAGCDGVLVDVGGDVRVDGVDARGEAWKITVRNPFGPKPLAAFGLAAGSVCTSGDYERFVEIDGVRHSHIIDPRTGRPAGSVPSVTVVATDAMTADAWATALGVLGAEGLDRLPTGVEALLVEGDERSCRMITNREMERRLGEFGKPPCSEQ
jgi:thiamine biosynthesis lipoprotein